MLPKVSNSPIPRSLAICRDRWLHGVMRKTQTNTAPTTLYWSERGHITCAQHAPCRGSDTWNWERWQPVPAEALELPGGDALRCESCGTEVRRG